MPADHRLSVCPAWCADHRADCAPDFVSHSAPVALIAVGMDCVAVDLIRHDIDGDVGEVQVQVSLSGDSGFPDIERLSRGQAIALADALRLAAGEP